MVKGGVLPASPYIGRVHRAVGLAAFFFWELVRANLRLALDVATPRYQMKPGILAIPLDATRDSEILLLAMLINLTPGSVALDVSDDRTVMYVHVMYIDSPEKARAEIKDGFERRVRAVAWLTVITTDAQPHIGHRPDDAGSRSRISRLSG